MLCCPARCLDKRHAGNGELSPVPVPAGTEEICYIGQSGNCAKRLLDHAKKSWDGKELQFSFHGVERAVLPHQLKEWENDLNGNYFEYYRKAPEYQFRNST
ncbi:MAG: hypothetical protein WCJ47_06770 [Methanomicrobiales archaeon]